MKKRENPRAPKLPKEFKKYFWDVEFKEASRPVFRQFALERILHFGNLKALRWLLQIPKNEIKQAVNASRELDAKTKNFWKVIYGF